MGVMILDGDDDGRMVRPVVSRSDWTLGLDLGMLQDPSAISIIERLRTGTGEWEVGSDKIRREKPVIKRTVRYLERLPLKVSYFDVVAYVCDMLVRPPVSERATLVVDRGGVGQGVLELFHARGVQPVTVFFTGGDTEHREGGDYRVPKTKLFNDLIADIDCGDLKAPQGIKGGEQLEEEMQDFRRTITANGHVRYEALPGRRDDMLCSLALANWWSRRPEPQTARMVPVVGL